MADEVKEDIAPEAEAAPKKGWLGLRMRLVIAGVALSCVLGGVAYLLTPSSASGRETIYTALEKLEEGDYADARRIAESFIGNYQLPEPEQAIPPYVLGSIAYHDSDQFWSEQDKQRIFLIAARYLRQSADLGYPEGYATEGNYMLGRSLVLSKQYGKSIPVLLKTYEAAPQYRREIEDMLASAYLADAASSDQQLTDALTWADKYLEVKLLSPQQRDAATLRRAKILLRLGRLDDAVAAVDQIAKTSPVYVDSLIVRGEVDLARAKQEGADREQELNDAIDLLRQAADNQLVGTDSTRASSYLLAVALDEADEKNAALTQATRTRKIYFRTPEGIAAGVLEGRLLRGAGKYGEAVDVYRRTLSDAALEPEFRNPYLTIEQLRIQVTAAIEQFLDKQQFQNAVDVAQALTPLFPRDQALQTEGDILVRWGETIMGQAQVAKLAEAEELRKEARERFRSAGRIYEKLAEDRFSSRSYTEELWKSAAAYFDGQDFTKSIEMLDKYSQYEERSRQPRALVAKARALIALDRADEALELIHECLDFYPRDPVIYDARLLASEAYLEEGDVALAEEMLQANLNDGRLEPQSLEWQNSLFALGRVMHLEGEMFEAQARVAGILEDPEAVPREAFELLEKSNSSYQMAIKNLKMAVRRYPNDPQSVMARYLAAECHRRSSMLPRKRFRLVDIETQRVRFDKEVKDHLEAALEIYASLVDELTEKFETRGELHPVNSDILRNSYFAQGAAYYDLHQFPQAIEAYSTASNRYQNDPIALEAFSQIANCYRLMGQPIEAKGTLEQAKIVLDRLPENADYSETSYGSADEWRNFIDWLISTL
ncbi:tetratricopeptide repeat protein [Blastopirellula marina]|nr:tetratricopeptide repeat protein [Blastopirellula marina]